MCMSPHAMLDTDAPPIASRSIFVGENWFAKLPAPSCPCKPLPQVNSCARRRLLRVARWVQQPQSTPTSPLPSIAAENSNPAAMDAHLSMPATTRGTFANGNGWSSPAASWTPQRPRTVSVPLLLSLPCSTRAAYRIQ